VAMESLAGEEGKGAEERWVTAAPPYPGVTS
jgi:hypothetical protein